MASATASTTGITTLFKQGSTPSGAYALQEGVTPQHSGLNADLWTSDTPPALSPVTWNPSQYTGFSDPNGTQVGTSPNTAGTTAAQVAPDSSEIGVLIDSNTFPPEPSGTPLPFTLDYQVPGTVMPFANSANAALVTSMNLQIPYSEATGSGSTASSNGLVLYDFFKDTTTGKTLAYGMSIFDSRGSAQDYIAGDVGHVGATGDFIVTAPAGENSPYLSSVSGAASFQGAPWTGMKPFVFEVTPQTLSSAIAAANARGGGFSTDVSKYQLTSMQVDAETAYFGTPNAFGYSVNSLTMQESPTVITSTSQMGGTSTAPGTTPGSPPPTSSPPSTTPDTLVLSLSEDAYRGNAHFIAKMDGTVIGSGDVTALHKYGQTQNFTYTGNWGSGPHSLELDFTNDAWGGIPSKDRNLYVNQVTYDGHTALSHTDALYNNGGVTINIPSS